MALNLLYSETIDQSVSQTLNLNVAGNILITRDANTPANDPVVVQLSDLADAQALNQIVIANGATGVLDGGLASLNALSGVTVDGGTLALATSLANVKALNTIHVGPDGGTIRVDSSALGVGVLSVPVSFVDSSGQATATVPANFDVDFPGVGSIRAYYDPTTQQTIIGNDLDVLGVVNVSTGPSLTIAGNPFKLTAGTVVTYTSSSNPDGSGGILVCFLADTLIRTPDGETPVQSLRVGDRVTTVEDGVAAERRVVWAGRKLATVRAGLPDDEAGYPVRIRAGALSDGVPHKDLLVTPEHCLFLDGGFIPARMLVNGRSVDFDRSADRYEVFHIETERHAVIVADGALTESYLDTGNRGSFRNHGVVVGFGAGRVRSWDADAAAPLTVSRERVEPVHRRLAARADANGFDPVSPPAVTADAELRLVTPAGEVLRPARRDGDHALFVLPAGTETVRILSRASRPSDVIGPFLDDRRRLGVLVATVELIGVTGSRIIDAHLRQATMEGWHGLDAGCRWTNGDAVLPLGAPATGSQILAIRIAAAGPYAVEADSGQAATVLAA